MEIFRGIRKNIGFKNTGFKNIGFAVRRAIVSGVSAYMIAAALSAAPVQAEDDRSVSLEYAIHIGGFETMRVSFNTALSATDYKMKMALDGQGVLDWWYSMRMSAFSEGRLADGTFVPVRAGADSAWNGKRRQIRLSYPGLFTVAA